MSMRASVSLRAERSNLIGEKASVRYCKKCDAIYLPRQLEHNGECAVGPVGEVAQCEECCPRCPHCGKLFELRRYV
jgi:hypothetical protein